MVANPWGFVRHPRVNAPKRPIPERLHDWHVVVEPPTTDAVRIQATRCMDCGVAFCHAGCPLANLIPDWNELTARDDWRAASEALHATNNFPEFTGWLCPAPCEPACVLAIDDEPVTIKQIELAIVERAFAEGWVGPVPPSVRTGKKVAVVGSGPGGLAAAQQLTRAGHAVTVFERDDRLGGLLRYGIPDFKMAKELIDRRLEQMTAEGTIFETSVDVGRDMATAELREGFDAIVLASGALLQREVPLPGRDLDGVHMAMAYLTPANRVQAGDLDEPPITAEGKRVVIIGGGDTAADCLGTANRQGAIEIHQVDHNPRPPEERRAEENPWPEWPKTHKLTFAHEEGVVEDWATEVAAFIGDEEGRVKAVRMHQVERRFVDGKRYFDPVPGSEVDQPAELVLLAAGFVGTDAGPLLDDLGVETHPDRGTVMIDDGWSTSADGVFACGDADRGASLVVWAIAEGRACAAAVDRYLMGTTALPAPVNPGERPL